MLNFYKVDGTVISYCADSRFGAAVNWAQNPRLLSQIRIISSKVGLVSDSNEFLEFSDEAIADLYESVRNLWAMQQKTDRMVARVALDSIVRLNWDYLIGLDYRMDEVVNAIVLPDSLIILIGGGIPEKVSATKAKKTIKESLLLYFGIDIGLIYYGYLISKYGKGRYII